MLNFIDFASRRNDITGWASYNDTEYTSSNKLSLTAGQDNQLSNNAGSVVNNQLPLGVTSFWSNNKITPHRSGDAYVLRITFSSEIANSAGYFDLKIDIGGSQGVILNKVDLFPKGGNTPHTFSTSNLIYTGDTFLANGGTIKINPSHTMLIWDINILIARIHKG